MPYKDLKNPKLIAYRKAYYLRTKESLRASRRASVKRFAAKNKEHMLTYNMLLIESNEGRKKRVMEYFKNYEKRLSDELADHYIKKQLKKDGFTGEHISEYPALIETKRIILKTKRLWKQSTTSTI